MPYRAIFHGRVQGVFFRAQTRALALKIGARGWVRNLPDGTVELVTDSKELIEAMASRRDPDGIFVESVELSEIEEQLPEGFEIRY